MFKQIKVGLMENFSYIIASKNTAALVDPSWEPEKLLDEIKDFENIIVILTHTHFDHMDGIDKIIAEVNPKIYVHGTESKIIKELTSQVIEVKDNEVIKVGDINIKVIHTPGHTPGGICLYFDNKIITGDTLFIGAVGRTDFPGGDLNELQNSLRKLMKLPDDTKIYPGHDYGGKVSTIKKEKEANPFVKECL